ncbi:hypothetical protein [uncultured Desulfovibrio sp.]|nr:hypothetical protein [uncultured Desulfovibrio sp.]
MATPRYRITLRQLVDEYLALHCTRPVTQASTRYRLAACCPCTAAGRPGG